MRMQASCRSGHVPRTHEDSTALRQRFQETRQRSLHRDGQHCTLPQRRQSAPSPLAPSPASPPPFSTAPSPVLPPCHHLRRGSSCPPLSPRRSFTREPRVRQITNAPFCVASGFAVRSSPGEATCSSGDAGGERAVSRACGTAFCAALALAAAAMMTRHDSVGGRERGSGSDRSGGVRRSRYERGARLRLCLAPVPCVSSHDAREGTALSGSPSPGRMPSTCGPNPEVPWRRRQHQCARPTQLVALPICRVCRCVCTAAPHAARTPQGAPARRLVNLVGFAFSVP